MPLRAITGFRNWAVAAFGLNLATGLVFFTGSTNQYVVNPYFWAKVSFLLLAVANAIAFETIIRRRSVQDGDDTPMSTRSWARCRWSRGLACSSAGGCCRLSGGRTRERERVSPRSPGSRLQAETVSLSRIRSSRVGAERGRRLARRRDPTSRLPSHSGLSV